RSAQIVAVEVGDLLAPAIPPGDPRGDQADPGEDRQKAQPVRGPGRESALGERPDEAARLNVGRGRGRHQSFVLFHRLQAAESSLTGTGCFGSCAFASRSAATRSASACERSYAFTTSCTSGCRTTSTSVKVQKAMPSTSARILRECCSPLCRPLGRSSWVTSPVTTALLR